jgi:hypothetical protein
MAYYGNGTEFFPVIADALRAEGVDDATKHDVLAALMDHIGVPMMCAEEYRNDPAIRALFAERGVTLLDKVAESTPAPEPSVHLYFMHDTLTPDNVRATLDLLAVPTVGDVLDVEHGGYMGAVGHWRVTLVVEHHNGAGTAAVYVTDAELTAEES